MKIFRDILINIIIGVLMLIILKVNYSISSWSMIMITNLIIMFLGWILLVILIIMMAIHLYLIKRNILYFRLSLIYYLIFLFILFFNPFQVDCNPHKAINAVMQAKNYAEFAFVTIVFDQDEKFYLRCASVDNVIVGNYEVKDRTIVLHSDFLPHIIYDTLLIGADEKFLYHSSKSTSELGSVLHFWKYEEPIVLNLLNGRRTLFEVL